MELKTQSQTFNSGIAKIYSVTTSGSMPKKKLNLKLENPLPYEERTVGMSRFWAAMQEQTKIEKLLRFPRVEIVQREDVLILVDGNQYEIKQVQYPPGVEPACMDLSLERIRVPYDITGS